jgi:hypothetical protein
LKIWKITCFQKDWINQCVVAQVELSQCCERNRRKVVVQYSTAVHGKNLYGVVIFVINRISLLPKIAVLKPNDFDMLEHFMYVFNAFGKVASLKLKLASMKLFFKHFCQLGDQLLVVAVFDDFRLRFVSEFDARITSHGKLVYFLAFFLLFCIFFRKTFWYFGVPKEENF